MEVRCPCIPKAKLFHLYSAIIITSLLVSGAAGVQAATYGVTVASDDGSTSNISGTLRWAVAQSNASIGAMDTIAFSVSNSITVLSPLTLTDPVIIDGRPNQPVIGAANTGVDLFVVATSANGSVLQGLAVINANNGIRLMGDSNQVLGCRIGVDWSGNPFGNINGITVSGINNQIGAAGANGNVISGNLAAGIYSAASTRLKVIHNVIGANAAGMLAVPNGKGITLANDTHQALIGGQFNNEGNLISGNSLYGVEIFGSGTWGNTLCGNQIGTNIIQGAAIPNTEGIHLDSAHGNYIGLAAGNYHNVICGNTQNAIAILSSTARARDLVIQNNYIGVNQGGGLIANAQGIFATCDSSLIGGRRNAGYNEFNLISNNTNYGVYLTGNGNTISGNYIGSSSDGLAGFGNWFGINLIGDDNLIGGANSGGDTYGNLVAAQTSNGVTLQGGSRNRIAGNWIGLAGDGVTALANGHNGVEINGATVQRTLIGGTDSSLRNVISGNSNFGVTLIDTSAHTLCGNFIGTDASGAVAVKNGADAVRLTNASGCLIGGTSPGGRNFICGAATAAGISLESSGTTGNTVVGNYLNLFISAGSPAEKLAAGVALSNSANGNSVGLKTLLAGNLIAGTGDGIRLSDTATNRNSLSANTICAFSGQGIRLIGGANNNQTAPVVTSAFPSRIAGTSNGNGYIEVFKSDRGAGFSGGSVRVLGSTVADGSGNWTMIPIGAAAGDYVCATAADVNNNTSPFSQNLLVITPSPTPTATPSPTASLTPTISPTPTQTSTPSASPTVTGTSALANVDLQGKFALVFPNPSFGPIQFLMHPDQSAEIKIVIYNSALERVSEIKQTLPAGHGQVINWKPNAGTGIYLARIWANGKEVQRVKLAVLR